MRIQFLGLGFLLLCLLGLGREPAHATPPGEKGAGDPAKGDGTVKSEKKQKQPKPNHLIHEKSPYLLQHAYNPVNWYPWGPEALARAKEENKPIFLSIGYSTCHWCHVMEEQSFENPEIATLLNRDFICVKVDREERPDLDKIYMLAVQALTGSGGWPLNVFLTPDLEPFFGGTYFPPGDMGGRTGMKTLIPWIAKVWKETPEKALDVGQRLKHLLQEQDASRPHSPLTTTLMTKAFEAIAGRFDATYGGFGQAPKFPQAMTLSFLLRHHHGTGRAEALNMVRQTLQQMARGGIYDQLGGGFHRYATDDRWLVPHFEKMLYDNAVLAQVYVEAFQVTGNAEFEQTARAVLDYVLRDMTDPQGGFYSAEDADSEGEEGTFYVWTPEQIETVLGRESGALFSRFYDVTPAGNFEGGRSILHQWIDLASFAKDRGMAPENLEPRLVESRRRLFDARAKRVRPHRDDKILTAWNGMMITTMAYAGSVLDEPRYTAAAERAGRFLLEHLWTKEGLLRRYREGEVRFPGYLDDYAFLVQGLIELYQSTFDIVWIEKALALNGEMVARFYDRKGGNFFFSQAGDASLISRTKELHDAAKPSGNAVAILNLLRLSEFTGEGKLREMAQTSLEALSGDLVETPGAFAHTLSALDFSLSAPMEIAVAGPPASPETQAMLRAIRKPFSPNKVVGLARETKGKHGATIPYLDRKIPIGDKPTVYICRNYTCKKPLTDPEEVRRALLRPMAPKKD